MEDGHSDSVTLTRDVEATRIPSGEQISLRAGTGVTITQALGGAYTVMPADGSGLFRVKASDADALGREAEADAAPDVDGTYSEEKVWEQLRNCYDPEIPINIVDLGLIYSLEAQPHPKGGQQVEVKMTLTAPGCGMGPSLAADAEQRIMSVSGVTDANVEIVWEPLWSPDRISPAGREKLGMV